MENGERKLNSGKGTDKNPALESHAKAEHPILQLECLLPCLSLLASHELTLLMFHSNNKSSGAGPGCRSEFPDPAPMELLGISPHSLGH